MNSEEKIRSLKGLNDKELKLLHLIMANPKLEIRDLADTPLGGESTIRNRLSDIFRKLQISGANFEKRGNLVREYSETYRILFPDKESVSTQPIQSTLDIPEIYVAPPDPIVVPITEQVDKSISSDTPLSSTPSTQVNEIKKTPNNLENLLPWILVFMIFTFVGMSIWLLTRDTKAEVQQLSLQAPFLLSEQFESNGGFFRSEENSILRFGNDNWNNYVVLARIVTYKCELPVGEEDRQSTIGVRYNGSTYYKAYSWKACEVSIEGALNEYKDIIITVNQDTIITNVNGEQLEPFRIADKEDDKGGIYIFLDKSSAIDFIVVSKLSE